MLKGINKDVAQLITTERLILCILYGEYNKTNCESYESLKVVILAFIVLYTVARIRHYYLLP